MARVYMQIKLLKDVFINDNAGMYLYAYKKGREERKQTPLALTYLEGKCQSVWKI